MSVKELISAILLISVTIASAVPKPTTIDDASLEVSDQIKKDGTMYDVLKIGEETIKRKLNYKRNEINGKDLDSEEYSDEYDYDEDDDEDDYEYDSNENEAAAEVTAASNFRLKRKVIFGGGGAGGGGIYSRGGRRGGGEEDPYGRRREHNGPMYGPSDSWPYRRPDVPSHVQSTSHVTPSTTGASATGSGSDSSPVYGTTRTHPTDEDSTDSASYDGSITSGRSDGRKAKPNRRETHNKGKLSKNLKWEIAQYAMQHGAQEAAVHFQERVGRRLRVKKIEKFIKRYQDKN